MAVFIKPQLKSLCGHSYIIINSGGLSYRHKMTARVEPVKSQNGKQVRTDAVEFIDPNHLVTFTLQQQLVL